MYIISNNKGFSLIETMIAATMTAVVVGGTMSYYISLQNRNVQNNIITELDSFNRELKANITNPVAWDNTRSNNTEFDCYSTNSCNTDLKKFEVFDKFSRSFYDAKSTNKGIALNGIACDTFNAALDSADCPVSLDLTWRVICDGSYDAKILGSKCAEPLVEVEAKYKKNQLASIANLNFNKLNFKYVVSMSSMLSVPAFVCKNHQGQIDKNGNCEVPMYSMDCSGQPGTMFQGIEVGADGAPKPKCEQFIQADSKTCPAGEAVTGYSSAGVTCGSTKGGKFDPLKIAPITEQFTAMVKATTGHISEKEVKVAQFHLAGARHLAKVANYNDFKDSHVYFVGSQSVAAKSDNDGRQWFGRSKNSATETYVNVEIMIRVPKSKVKTDDYGNLLRKIEEYQFVSCTADDSRSAQNSGSCRNISYINN
ncbi:MAG: PilW family protein [Pseudobdellovibrionaceae bacterium]